MQRVAAVLLSLFITDTAFAHELTTTLGAKSEFSDNIRKRDLDNPPDDLLSTLSLNVDYQYEFTSVTAIVDYSVRQLNFRDDSFDDRTDFLGTANVTWELVPKRFSWNFAHIRDRVLTDRQLVDTPANEQDRSTISSGPQLQLNFGRGSALLFRSNYIVNDTEQSSRLKSSQVQSQATYQRPLGSQRMEVSASRSHVNYGDSSLDYTNERYSFGLSGAGALVSWNLNIGQNTIERADSSSTSGLFYSAGLNITRNDLSIALRTNRELTDNQIGLNLNENLLDPLDNGDGGIGAFDIVERIRHEMILTQSFQRLSATYSVTRDLQDFQSLTQDETLLRHSLSFAYQQSPTLSWNLQLSRQSSNFQVPASDNTSFIRYERRLTLNMQLNTKLNLNLWVLARRRSADSGTIESFREEGLGAEMTYRI